MAIRWFMVLLLLAVSLQGFAKELPPEDCAEDSAVEKHAKSILKVTSAMSGCADASKLVGICGDVFQQSQASHDTPYMYEYERKLHEAACADPEKDSEEIVNKKLQNMWIKLDKNLKCDTANWEVPKGNILKYAIKVKSFDLITSAAELWHVNLNSIDSTDSRTLLDYVESEMERNKGDRLEGVLKGYYKILRNAGAKHRKEL